MRHAAPRDAPQIAGVHTRSWQVAYRGQLPDELLDAMDPDDRTGSWRRRLTATDATSTLVAVDEPSERIVGFVFLGPTRDGTDTASPGDPGSSTAMGEIYALYVDPPRWRTGVGSTLLTAATDRLRGEGYEQATLWALGNNTGTRRFYERHAWRPDGLEGTARIGPGGSEVNGHGTIEVPELRYTIDLTRGPPSPDWRTPEP